MVVLCSLLVLIFVPPLNRAHAVSAPIPIFPKNGDTVIGVIMGPCAPLPCANLDPSSDQVVVLEFDWTLTTGQYFITVQGPDPKNSFAQTVSGKEQFVIGFYFGHAGQTNPFGTWTWSVDTVDSNGNRITGPTNTFTEGETLPTPRLLSPPNDVGTTDHAPTFSWSSEESLLGNCATSATGNNLYGCSTPYTYDLKIWVGPSNNPMLSLFPPLYDFPGLTSTSLTPSTPLSVPFGTAQWGVVATDAAGRVSAGGSGNVCLQIDCPLLSPFDMNLVVLQTATSTAIVPQSLVITTDQTITVTARVTTTGQANQLFPTGTVTWAATAGTFSGLPCTLTEVSQGVSSCSAVYTAPSTAGPYGITGTYVPATYNDVRNGASYNVNAPSSGSASLRAISLAVTGVSSGTVLTTNSGNYVVTLCCDVNGNTVAVITYPPGTDFSGGTITGDVSTANGITMVEVSGPTLPAGATKSISLRPDPTVPTPNTICVVDSPSPPATPNCSATDTSTDTIVFVTSGADGSTTFPCDGSRVTLGSPSNPFPSGESDPRTFTCTPPSSSSPYFQVTGLSFSRVEIMSARLKVTQFFTDGERNPLQTDANGNPSVIVVQSSKGVVKSTNPGVVREWVNATNTGVVSLDSIKLQATLPVDWSVSPDWPNGKGAIHVFLEFTNGTLVEITDPGTIKVSTGNPQIVTISIPDLKATLAGTSLMQGMSILASVKMTYSLKGTLQPVTSYPRTYTATISVTGWATNSFTSINIGGTTTNSFIAYTKTQ